MNEENKAYSLAIGFFDGVHRGHQAVIGKAIEKSKEYGFENGSNDI